MPAPPGILSQSLAKPMMPERIKRHSNLYAYGLYGRKKPPRCTEATFHVLAALPPDDEGKDNPEPKPEPKPEPEPETEGEYEVGQYTVMKRAMGRGHYAQADLGLHSQTNAFVSLGGRDVVTMDSLEA